MRGELTPTLLVGMLLMIIGAAGMLWHHYNTGTNPMIWALLAVGGGVIMLPTFWVKNQ